MQSITNDTAVLLFSRTAAADARAKAFFGQAFKQNKKLSERLIQKTIKTIRASKLPYFIYSEKEQLGTSFGERLSNAASAVFAAGFKKLIIIGNDAPDLTPAHIKKAEQKLQDTNGALAPTDKGGVSLIGLTSESFCKKEFSNISWQTDKVYEQLLVLHLDNSRSVFTLETLPDLNTLSDVITYCSKRERRPHFFSFLLSLIASLRQAASHYIQIFILHKPYSNSGLRAPPAL